jgi:predicted DCC family thiol-disulfide oxidoreductase YuxK
VSPSWVDGTAVEHVLMNPLARPGWLREMLLGLPGIALHLATWGGLGLELAFAPLAIIRRTRPWIWAAMLAMHLLLTTLIDFADLSLGMVMLHLFTFDPVWVRPRAGPPTTIFYDGHCRVCHGFVRWVIAEDRSGEIFRFAPLGGTAYHATLWEVARRDLPDTVVVRSSDGRLLSRSAAALHVAERLGGAWRVLAVLLRTVPARLRDRGYDGVARVLRSLFAPPADTCPVLPGELRLRFDS